MKRLLIPCICFIAAFSLAGCANDAKTSDTLNALNNQLTRVESIVSTTSINEMAEVSPSITLSSDQPYNSIQTYRALSNEKMLREEEIRQEILNMNACLKSCIDKEYKLTKKQRNEIKDITNNLSKYTSNLNGTKTQVKSSVNSIKKNLKITNMNVEGANSSYISLNSTMNERYAYLSNIYDNLEEVCIILDCKCAKKEACENCEKQNSNETTFENSPYTIDDNTKEEKETKETTNDKSEEKGSFKIVKNIDSYSPVKETSPINNEALNNSPQSTNDQNAAIFNNQTYQNPQPIQQPIPRPYPNGNFANGNYYNYNYANNRINPNRNTDTFYSYNRNIDTYRYYPNFYNNIPLY